jgi:hypothetical protein
MPLNDAPGNREPQPGATCGTGLVGSIETIEDGGQVFGSDADAGIPDGHLNDAILCIRSDADLSALCEFDGIIEQIHKQADQVIAFSPYAQVRFDVPFEKQALVLDHRLHGIGHILQQR